VEEFCPLRKVKGEIEKVSASTSANNFFKYNIKIAPCKWLFSCRKHFDIITDGAGETQGDQGWEKREKGVKKGNARKKR
jgi:hypothetical protein